MVAMPRTAQVVPATTDEPADFRLVFYGGLIDVGVDEGRRFVGAKVEGDLDPDEPLFVAGEGVPDAPLILTGLPVHLLRDRAERIIGVHVVGSHRARRIGEA